MVILGLTSFDQIRGVLAVSSADLTDETLSPRGLEDELTADLEGWLESWESIRDGGTEKQKRQLRLYAKYYLASVVAEVAQNFVLQRFTDGEIAGQRSDTEGFATWRASLRARADKYRRDIEDDQGVTPATTTRRIFGVVSPARDVITTGRG